MNFEKGRVILESSDKRLVDGFNWAKKQALEYVFEGDQVGDWYEAALPGREAFCMRDVSHQSAGANILGLQSFNKNMLYKFAANISKSRDWCSYWEINKYDKPAPVDYEDDSNFWYNLPANFDVLDCCYRQYLWTGDMDYIEDKVFNYFYDRTVTDYVKAWDINGDGLLEHIESNKTRGIASYDEDDFGDSEIFIGSDLIAAQFAAYKAYGEIQKLKSNDEAFKEFAHKAEWIKEYFNSNWIIKDTGRYYAAILENGRKVDKVSATILYFNIVNNKNSAELILDDILYHNYCDRVLLVEAMSHIPEVLYKFGRYYDAYSYLMRLTDPSLKRREYPEVSYSVIGSIGNGLMGISADARHNTVNTLSGLICKTREATLKNVPILRNELTVEHRGNYETSITNQYGECINWKAMFEGKHEELKIDGVYYKANQSSITNERMVSWVNVSVGEAQKHTVTI